MYRIRNPRGRSLILCKSMRLIVIGSLRDCEDRVSRTILLRFELAHFGNRARHTCTPISDLSFIGRIQSAKKIAQFMQMTLSDRDNKIPSELIFQKTATSFLICQFYYI